MTRALDLLEDGVAAHRLTRLLVEDSILDGPRDALLEHLDGGGPTARKAAEGLRCYWCTGFWVALAVSVASSRLRGSWRWTARALTISTIAGALGDRL